MNVEVVWLFELIDVMEGVVEYVRVFIVIWKEYVDVGVVGVSLLLVFD